MELKWKVFVLVLLYNVSSLTGAKDDGSSSSYKKAQSTLRHMLKRSEPMLRPHAATSVPVLVKLGVSILDIIDYQREKKGKEATVRFLAWLNYEWQDERLSWLESKVPGVSSFKIPTSKIWKPDIWLYNSLNPKPLEWNSEAVVMSDGTVTVVAPTELTVHCNATSSTSPTTDCQLKFGSWKYDGLMLNLTNSQDKADMSYFNDKTWKILENRAVRHVVKYECCPEPYIDLTYYLGMG